jgi:hypothetical protein
MMRNLVWHLLALLLIPGSSFAEHSEEHRPSRFNLSVNGGTGLMRTVSPYTLKSGEVAAAISIMNYDRYPADVDFVEFLVQGSIGLPGRTEFYFRASPTFRSNSVAQDPIGYPVPPLDLFVDVYPTEALRQEPYFLYAQEVPYKTYFVDGITIRPPGDGAFASSTGDLVLGLKVNLFSEDRGDFLGFGVRGYAEFPTETPAYNVPNWRDYAGVSGERDYGFNLLFSKMLRRAEVLVDLGYKKIGDPSRGLRVQFVNSAFDDPEHFLVGDPIERGLDLHDILSVGAGMTVPAFGLGPFPVWFMSEFSYERYVGNGTSVERLVHPAEMRLGLQSNLPFYKAVSFGFAWQLTFNDAGDGGQRWNNFVTASGDQGDINFSELVDPDLSETVRHYFTDRGATFSDASSKVFSTDNTAFDDWRNISTDPQVIVGQGGGAALFFLTWHIGSAW